MAEGCKHNANTYIQSKSCRHELGLQRKRMINSDLAHLDIGRWSLICASGTNQVVTWTKRNISRMLGKISLNLLINLIYHIFSFPVF